MELGITGKVIIISGGAKGIGLGIAMAVAAEGGIPVIIGRNETDNQLSVSTIEKVGGNAFAVVAELSRPEDCRRAIDEVVEKYGRVDGLVNNAGLNDGVSLAEGSYESFIRSLHNSLVHYYLLAHYALPWLIKSQGSIVNISSKTAETGQGGTSGYAASNGGRNALTREWAVELLPYQIRVNAVVVAESYTPQYENWISALPNHEEKLKEITAKIPLGKRMTTVEEIADMVVFLLSPRSSHTTGQLIHVDGGYVHLDRAL